MTLDSILKCALSYKSNCQIQEWVNKFSIVRLCFFRYVSIIGCVTSSLGCCKFFSVMFLFYFYFHFLLFCSRSGCLIHDEHVLYSFERGELKYKISNFLVNFDGYYKSSIMECDMSTERKVQNSLKESKLLMFRPLPFKRAWTDSFDVLSSSQSASC